MDGLRQHKLLINNGGPLQRYHVGFCFFSDKRLPKWAEPFDKYSNLKKKKKKKNLLKKSNFTQNNIHFAFRYMRESKTCTENLFFWFLNTHDICRRASSKKVYKKKKLYFIPWQGCIWLLNASYLTLGKRGWPGKQYCRCTKHQLSCLSQQLCKLQSNREP